MFFLNVAMTRAIHSDLIAQYGGSHGVGDAGLLESALARPQMLLHDRPEVCLGELAAVLGWVLIRSHAFLDGNKRIGFAAVVTFLKLNGYEFRCAEVEETATVLRAAAGEMAEEEWTAWVERSVLAV